MPSAPTVPSPSPDWPLWVPAAKVRNHVLEDPILDWLDEWGEAKGFQRDDSASRGYIPETDFSKFVRDQGKAFENGVLRLVDEILSDNALAPIVRVACSPEDVRSGECRDRTLALMREGLPVVYQGVLWDGGRGVYGSPDLLVRSDVLNLIVCDSLSDEDAARPAPAIGAGGWHYVVVDVKFTTLRLNAQGEVGNDGSGPAHKAQLALYNAALGSLQGYEPPMAFLIGRGWEKSRERGHSCLEKVGRVTIDQPQFRADNVHWLARAMEAVEWIRRVRKEGESWECPPAACIREMRPNMGNQEDAPWHQAKKKIAKESGELTSVWEVGWRMRDAFVETYEIDDWRHHPCTAELLAPFDGRGHLWSKKDSALADKGHRLKAILEINKEGCDDVVRPAHVSTERDEWGTPEAVEFFVDFETCSDLDDDFERLPEKNGKALIFMVGCGHYEQGEWKFEVFTEDALDEECEGKVLKKWTDHMEAVRNRLAPELERPKVFHWSPAEVSTLSSAYNSAATRHPDLAEPNWFDFLNRVIKPKGCTECVVVKGAMGFGLKAIGKALFSHGLIETNWEDGPTDGLGAMTGAWWCYREAKRRGMNVRDVATPEREGQPCRELMREIERYNEVDCKVMAEVIGYLRRRH